MSDLNKAIMGALAEAGIEHDDLDTMSDVVEGAILSDFVVTRKEEGDLAARLDSFQRAVLDGQERDESLYRKLASIKEQIADVIDCSQAQGATFEEMEQLKQLERKLEYLDGLLDKLSYDRRLRKLQDALRRPAPGKAWDIYLQIAELMNQERTRLLSKAEGASR